MARGPNWTKKEDAIIETYAQKETAESIAVRLTGRTATAVKSRAYVIDVKLTFAIAGEGHYKSKLTDREVMMARTLHNAGFGISEIHRANFSRVQNRSLGLIIEGLNRAGAGS